MVTGVERGTAGPDWSEVRRPLVLRVIRPSPHNFALDSEGVYQCIPIYRRRPSKCPGSFIYLSIKYKLRFYGAPITQADTHLPADGKPSTMRKFAVTDTSQPLSSGRSDPCSIPLATHSWPPLSSSWALSLPLSPQRETVKSQWGPTCFFPAAGGCFLVK